MAVAVICTSQQFVMKVENVDELKTTFSPKYNLRGTNWFVKFEKLGDNLGVYLHKEKSGQDFTFSVEAAFNVKLSSFRKEVEPIEEDLKHTFSSQAEGFGWPKFISWDTFTDEDNQYLHNNAALFDISIKIEKWKPICEREDKSLPKCPICLEQIKGENMVATKCGHLFCSQCISSSIDVNPICPLCKKNVTKGTLRKIFLQ